MKRVLAYFLIFAVLGANSSLGQVEVFTGHRRVNPVHARIGIAQSCYVAPNTVYDCVMDNPIAAGDVLVFYSFNNEYASIPISPSSTLWCSWTIAQTGIQEFFMATTMAWCQATVSGNTTLSIGPQSGTNFMVIEVSGTALSSPIDASASITFSSTSTTVANTITTTVANDMILSFEAYEYGTTSMAASSGWGWVTGNGLGLTTFRPMNGFSQVATAAGAYPVTFTNTNGAQARGFSSTMIAIKPL